MEEEGISPYSCEPIPQARGLGGCQPPTSQDGQAGESAGDSAQLPEKKKSDKKKDKKVLASDTTSTEHTNTLVSEPTVEKEVIPTPKLFMNMLQQQWASPGAAPLPTTLDKCLYNVASDLSKFLETLPVDAPVAAWSSPTVVSGVPEEAIKPEEKRHLLATQKQKENKSCLYGFTNTHPRRKFWVIGLLLKDY
ncbi:PREDICTED: uncharacterized protein LOC106541349 isoform X2 [Thamnophis sirtalis]|uniref:Uncharacterized protein LOC106541349 isoform X2 n=1 Tax=Thamnophis sirtalis TaxID=35019 RepID=A0A6I9X9F7_9SAUR|nr:PREDICTED: uncharacterized protein LOC106541349 isoform X2 [Thamnophis sirtalis]